MDYDVRQAWIELWLAVFGEPPPTASETELTAKILIQHLPPTPPYEVKSRTE